MNATIEALYIYDERDNCILEHIYQSRPPAPKPLLSEFKAHAAPRPALLYLSTTSPPTNVISAHHSNTLFLCPSGADQNALAILEFVHRVIDIFEDFLGAPLLAHKIESSYDIVAQLLTEICDGGAICNTEPNALREKVEVAGLVGKLFTQVGLAGSSPALGPSKILVPGLKTGSNLSVGPAIPWRRPNVRHTSNELYVDILENVSVILAPSGRPISAISSGSIAFTAKISGVPDLLLKLSAPGGSSNRKESSVSRTLQCPVFHPCVRLARWREHPGELSFIPPDGRFVLAGYEVDLLPSRLDVDKPPSVAERLFMPVTVDLRTGLGERCSDFEVRLTLNTNFPGVQISSNPGGSVRPGTSTPSFSFGLSNSGSSDAPALEAVSVSVPLPDAIRGVTDLRPTRGEAIFLQFERRIEWRVPTKDDGTVNGTAVLCGTLISPAHAGGADDDDEDEYVEEDEGENSTAANPLLGYYDEDSANIPEAFPPSQSSSKGKEKAVAGVDQSTSTPVRQRKRATASRAFMPRSVNVSFTVRGWLPSGIKVESLVVDARRSKDVSSRVMPYKGVKYITVSRRGIERRA